MWTERISTGDDALGVFIGNRDLRRRKKTARPAFLASLRTMEKYLGIWRRDVTNAAYKDRHLWERCRPLQRTSGASSYNHGRTERVRTPGLFLRSRFHLHRRQR